MAWAVSPQSHTFKRRLTICAYYKCNYQTKLNNVIFNTKKKIKAPFAGGGFAAAAGGARDVAAGLAVVIAAAAVFCRVILDCCNVLDMAVAGFFFGTAVVSTDGAGSTR